MLDKEKERELLVRHKNGDRAATDRLVREFARFIRSIAKKRGKGHSDIEDLVQEGVIGFIKCLNKFDLSYDVRVATYAHHYVNQALQIYMHKQCNTISVPYTEKRRAVIAEVVRLKNDDLTFEEMVDKISANTTLPRALVSETCMSAIGGVYSLDAPTIGGDGAMVETIAADVDTEADVIADMLNDARRAAISDAMSDMSDRDIDIINSRLMCEDEPEISKTIAERYGVSKQRIYQLQAKVESKLRLRLSPELI